MRPPYRRYSSALVICLIGCSGLPKVPGGLLAAFGDDVVADLLTFHESTHTGALDCADMYENVLRAIRRLDESKALLNVEEFNYTCGHRGFLVLHACAPAMLTS